MNMFTNFRRLLDQANINSPMIITTYYRTKDNRADYHFSLEQQSDGTWLVYILTDVDYQGRPDGCHPTHLLSDGDRHYVCWTRSLRSQEEARQVAALWADKTQRYIRFGESF